MSRNDGDSAGPSLGERPAGQCRQCNAAAIDGECRGNGCADAHRGISQPESGHRDNHQQIGGGQEGAKGDPGRGNDPAEETGTDRGGEGVQEPAEADSGETDQICYARTDIHVPDGFPRAEPL